MAELLGPKGLFLALAKTIPKDFHEHMIMVGSLAAGYHFHEKLGRQPVRTKDADAVVQPAGDIKSIRQIAETLLSAGWRRSERHNCKGNNDPLSVIRLNPPDSIVYFVELLALPEEEQLLPKVEHQLELEDGFYVAPSFRFHRLILEAPHISEEGLRYAQASMLALSNLLPHLSARSYFMTELVEGRKIMRSAKDLGRVLAIAYLAERQETEKWLPLWDSVIRKYFPKSFSQLMADAGQGLQELIADENGDVLEQAHFTCNTGLLAGKGFTIEQLRATAGRLLGDVILPLRQAGMSN